MISRKITVLMGLCCFDSLCAQTGGVDKSEISYLSRYSLNVLPGFSIDFFMEPSPEFPSVEAGQPLPVKSSTADKAKVFITPYVTVPVYGVDIVDENGDWLTLNKLSPESAKKAKIIIDVKVVSPPIEDVSWAKKMIAVAKSIEPKPALRVKTSEGYAEVGVRKKGDRPGYDPIYGNPFTVMEDPIKAEARFKWYLDSYSFEPMAVRDLTVQVSCMGKTFPASTFGNKGAFIQLNSVFRVVVEPGDISTIKAFRKGQFQVIASYSTSLSNAEVGSVVEDVSGYTSFVYEEFKKEIQQRSKTGSSFFIFSNSSSRVSKWLTEEVSKNSQRYSGYSKTVIQRNVKSDRIVRMMDDFAWPETTRDRVIDDHVNAGKAARAEGKVDLAKAHDDYAAALMAAQNNQAPTVDPVKAAAALVQGDFLSFLASGVAISDIRVSGNLTYRRIRSGSFSDHDLKQFNAIFLTSTESESLVTVADFPFQSAISMRRDSQPDLARQEMVEIVKDSKNVITVGPWFFEIVQLLD